MILSYQPMPSESEIHIWIAQYAFSFSSMQNLDCLLSEDELNRKTRFVDKNQRNIYGFSHGILRLILGAYLAIPGNKIKFVCNRHGKPFICQPDDNELTFNLSHSGTMVAVACSRAKDIGIDIESSRPLEQIQDIASFLFCQNELHKYSTLPFELKRQYLLQTWTRKEGYLKAKGSGLSQSLTNIIASPLDQEIEGKITDSASSDTRIWRYHDLQVPEGYYGSIVYNGEKLDIKYMDLPVVAE